MKLIRKIKVATGLYWVEIPEAELYVLCGCPDDSVKHLIKTGLIKTIEEEGLSYETGPNAILFSEVPVQNGQFSNLAEFIVLQMLYRQGMILPNHPNNTGDKPLLIGTEKQVNAQMQYTYRGNYGLVSEEELISGGADEEMAREMMRMKLKFALGKIRKTEELLDFRYVGQDSVEIKNEVYICHTGFNRYEFKYNGESIDVDLNLNADDAYKPPYELGFYNIKREYFAVIHSGDADGWDPNHPCMSSVLFFQGKIYLIDAGPNISTTLMALGISINEIEGVFHTHAHDDHFAGLTALIHADHRIKYYTTSIVRASVAKKLSALLSWDSDYMDRFFEIHDLEFNAWNNIEGLEVKPVISLHPLETVILTFRTLWEDGYRSYAHLANLASFSCLENMITEDFSKPGISLDYYNQALEDYLAPVNLKKVDAGGGLIHGDIKDFLDDTTEKIIRTHTSSSMSTEEKKISSNAPFGMVDVLIPAYQDYSKQSAAVLLLKYFPEAPAGDLQMLLNFKVLSLNAGSILLKEGCVATHIYLVLTGIVEIIHSGQNNQSLISAMGSLLGELSGLMAFPAMETYRTVSFVRALKIPSKLYRDFVKRNKLYSNIERIADNRNFLQRTWLFGEMLSYPVINNIADQVNIRSYSKGENIQTGNKSNLILLKEGQINISADGKVINTIHPGDFCGEENILDESPVPYKLCVAEDSDIFEIPGDILENIPIVLWKLLESSEKRTKNKVIKMEKKDLKEGMCFSENLPGFDIESGLKRVSGNRLLYTKMLMLMQNQYNNAAGKIRNSITNGDLDTALLITHNLKGVSGNLGAKELNASASKLENAIINMQNAFFLDLLNRMEKDLDQVFESIGILKKISLVNDKTTDKTTQLNLDNIRLIMVELSNLIEKNSLDVDNCLEDLKVHLDGLQFREDIKKLETSLDAFDYEAAQSILSKIAKDIDVSLGRKDK